MGPFLREYLRIRLNALTIKTPCLQHINLI
jgi:hypothetical protein